MHKQNRGNIDVGKYIYYEPDREIIHVDGKRKKLNYWFVKSERPQLSEIVEWRDKDFEHARTVSFCPLCVSDKDYDFYNRYYY